MPAAPGGGFLLLRGRKHSLLTGTRGAARLCSAITKTATMEPALQTRPHKEGLGDGHRARAGAARVNPGPTADLAVTLRSLHL